MLINQELAKAINEQIGREFHAKLRYVNTAAYFDTEDLPQLATFFYNQSQDEDLHAMKFVHYLVDAGARIQIPAIDQPMDFAVTLGAFRGKAGHGLGPGNIQ